MFVPGEDKSEVEYYKQTHLLILLRKLTKLKVKMKRKEKNEKIERLSIEHKAMSPSVYSRAVVFIVLGCLFCA